MATVSPLIVGMANILLYGAAFTMALGAGLVCIMHRSAAQARRTAAPARINTPIRPQPVRPQMFQM
jgi:hypothetical protein